MVFGDGVRRRDSDRNSRRVGVQSGRRRPEGPFCLVSAAVPKCMRHARPPRFRSAPPAAGAASRKPRRSSRTQSRRTQTGIRLFASFRFRIRDAGGAKAIMSYVGRCAKCIRHARPPRFRSAPSAAGAASRKPRRSSRTHSRRTRGPVWIGFMDCRLTCCAHLGCRQCHR